MVNELGMRLLKKHTRPERAQSIAYGNAIRENIQQNLSPERAQSIRFQAFSLMLLNSYGVRGLGGSFTPSCDPHPPSGTSLAPFAFGIFPKRGKEKDNGFKRGKEKDGEFHYSGLSTLNPFGVLREFILSTVWKPPSPAPFAFGIFLPPSPLGLPPKGGRKRMKNLRGKEKDRKILRGCVHTLLIFAGRCPALLMQGLCPLPLRGLRGMDEKVPQVPRGRHFINRRWSEAQSTDKTPPQPHIPYPISHIPYPISHIPYN